MVLTGRAMPAPPYAELHAHTSFSFLDGARRPADLVARAVELGSRALAATDRQGLYGVVRFATAAEEAGLHPVIGVEVELADPAGAGPGRDWSSRVVGPPAGVTRRRWRGPAAARGLPARPLRSVRACPAARAATERRTTAHRAAHGDRTSCCSPGTRPGTWTSAGS